MRAFRRCLPGGSARMNATATPNMKYRIGQTTPNAQPGGMKEGFARASNQSFPYPEFDRYPLKEPASMIAGTEKQAIRHHSRRASRSAILHCSQQELDIAFRPLDRALRHAKHRPALRLNPAFGLCADALVDDWVPHDTALADFLPPGLKLRLHQRDQLSVRFRKPERGFQYLRKRDEARVANDDIDWLRDLL